MFEEYHREYDPPPAPHFRVSGRPYFATVWRDGQECCASCGHPLSQDCTDLCCAGGLG